MIIGFITTEIIVLGLFGKLILDVSKQFNLNQRYIRLFVIPLVLFVIGFTLRISGNNLLIDLGYFFTEFTALFVSTLFVIFLCVGQIKYWKI